MWLIWTCVLIWKHTTCKCDLMLLRCNGWKLLAKLSLVSIFNICLLNLVRCSAVRHTHDADCCSRSGCDSPCANVFIRCGPMCIYIQRNVITIDVGTLFYTRITVAKHCLRACNVMTSVSNLVALVCNVEYVNRWMRLIKLNFFFL